MSKEEFLKIQTCVLKVNIHCDGCKHKVKKILQKIEGVYKISIDSDLGKVTVSGNVDPPTLIKKLGKNGKHAELWAAPKPNQNQFQNQNQNQNQNQFLNQLKNLQIDHGKGGNGNNPPKGGQNGQKGMFVNNPPKGGQNGQFPNQQQLMQMKAFQDMKLPPLKDFKLPNNNNNNGVKDQKAVKFNLPDEDDLSDDGEFDDEFDDDEDDYDDDDDMDDDDIDDMPPHRQADKTKPSMGNGPNPNMMMNPHLMSKIVNGGGQNGQKGGPGGASLGPNPFSAKKGGGGNGNSMQIQGGGSNMGKGGGGEGKTVNNGGGGQNKSNGGGGGQNGNFNANGGKKSGMSEGSVQGLPNMGNGIQGMSKGPMGQMGPMGQVQAVRGLSAGGMGGGGGYFGGGEAASGNQYQQYQQQQQQQQQQMAAAMMMNQQRANGNEQFHPMMYARPPPAVNYMPPPYAYTYPYPPGYPPPPGEPYTHAFSDENTSSCNVM